MKMVTPALCACLLLAAAVAGTVRAQSASYNFNSGQSDFNSKFTSNGAAGNGVATISATGGINNSGSLSTTGVTNHSIVFNTPLPNSSGTTITTSLFFVTKATLDTGDLVGIGLLASTTTLWDAGNSVFYKINGNNSSSLLASTWYELTATITNTGTTYHPVLTLQSYGSNGTTPSGTLITLPASDSTGGGLLSAGSVYAGIYGGAAFGATVYKTPAIDNFSVSAIPEPSTYAAMAGGAALAVAGWRRRRQRGSTR